METFTMVLILLTSAGVAGGVVFAFSAAMNSVILRVVPGDLAAGVSKYSRFALFVTALVGGLRLAELDSLARAAEVDANRCLLEAYRSAVGALDASLWLLLVFFGAGLAAYAGLHLYSRFGVERFPRRGEPERLERKPPPGVPAGRL
jgi:hypothetical protein